MFNPFKVRKYAALVVPQLIGVVTFFVLVSYFNFWYGIGGFVVTIFLGIIIGSALLKNPFQSMQEGNGLLAMKMDSTGVIVPFIINISGDTITGNYGTKQMSDVWDRNATFQITEPILTKSNSFKVNSENGDVTLKISSSEFNSAKMRMVTFPTLIYNEQLNTLITKDWFSEQEKDLFAQHILLMNNRQLQDLNSNFRDFARSVVELLKPIKNVMGSKWFWIIIVIVLGGVAAMFAPKIMAFIQGKGTAAIAGASNTAQGATITPR